MDLSSIDGLLIRAVAPCCFGADALCRAWPPDLQLAGFLVCFWRARRSAPCRCGSPPPDALSKPRQLNGLK